MCKRIPCLPTPDDAEKIFDAGLGGMIDLIIVKDIKTGNRVPVLSPKRNEKGCVFQDEKDLCILHDKGLKPTEGKIAIHNKLDEGIRVSIAYNWISAKGISVFKKFGIDEKIINCIETLIPFVKNPKITELNKK